MVRIRRTKHCASGTNHISQEGQDPIEREVEIELIERAVNENHVSAREAKLIRQNFRKFRFGELRQARNSGSLAFLLFANNRLVGNSRKNLSGKTGDAHILNR